MFYRTLKLSDELVYIKWYATPTVGGHPESTFIDGLKMLLDSAEGGLYFISDLRFGRIMDMRIIQQLAALTKHPHWADSTAFSRSPVSAMLVSTFSMFAKQSSEHHEIWNTPEEAVAYLETLKPGIAKDIDWGHLLAGDEWMGIGQG